MTGKPPLSPGCVDVAPVKLCVSRFCRWVRIGDWDWAVGLCCSSQHQCAVVGAWLWVSKGFKAEERDVYLLNLGFAFKAWLLHGLLLHQTRALFQGCLKWHSGRQWTRRILCVFLPWLRKVPVLCWPRLVELRNPFFLCLCEGHFWVDSSGAGGCSGLLRGGVQCFVPAAPELVFPGMSACRHDSWEPFTTWKGLPRGIPAPPGICKGNS